MTKSILSTDNFGQTMILGVSRESSTSVLMIGHELETSTG